MITPERGIKRIRIAAASLTLGALATVGITSGLAYADTTSAKSTDTSTTSTDSGTTGTSEPTSSDGSTTSDSTTTFGDSPGVSTGSGDSHAQTSGS